MSVTNLFNDKIGDNPVAIIDNFFNKDIVTNWLEYYQHKADFRYAVEEVENGDALLCHCLELPQVESIFNMSETLMPFVNEFNELYNTDLKYTDMCRAHVNLITSNDKFSGHTDSTENGMVVLWFANPNINDLGAGFFLGKHTDETPSRLISNKFNRLVVFPASMWHSVQAPTNRCTFRISVYLGFAQYKTNESRERNYRQQNLVNKFNKRVEVHG